MPLDGHSYLVAQGWSGKGTGLRQGAISRPLAIPQKKTLAGLGKDRDEAFPFWDHLFSAAAKSIRIKVSGEDADSDGVEENDVPEFRHTSTGILSNRRPLYGTPAITSGTNTPDSDPTPPVGTPRLTMLAIAKREAAKQGLYSRFYRGPVIGPNNELSDDDGKRNCQTLSGVDSTTVSVEKASQAERSEKKLKKCKLPAMAEDEIEDERRERKRRKKASKEKKRESIFERKEKDMQMEAGGICAGENMKELNKKERKKLRRERREARLKAKETMAVGTEGPSRIVKEEQYRGEGGNGKEKKLKVGKIDGELSSGDPSGLKPKAKTKRKLDMVLDEVLSTAYIGDPAVDIIEISKRKKGKFFYPVRDMILLHRIQCVEAIQIPGGQ